MMISPLKFIKKSHVQVVLMIYFTLSLVAMAGTCTSTVETNVPGLAKSGKTPEGLDKYTATINITEPGSSINAPDDFTINIIHRCPRNGYPYITTKLIVDVISDGKLIGNYYKDTDNLLEIQTDNTLWFKTSEGNPSYKGADNKSWYLFSPNNHEGNQNQGTGYQFDSGLYNSFQFHQNLRISNNFKTSSIVIIKPPEPLKRILYLGGVKYQNFNSGHINDNGLATLVVTVNLPIASDPDICSAKIFKVSAPETVDFGAIYKAAINDPNYKISRDFDIRIEKMKNQTAKCSQTITPKIFFESGETLISSNTAAKLTNGLALKIKDKRTGNYVDLSNQNPISGPEIPGELDTTIVTTPFTAELTKAPSTTDVTTGKFETTVKYIIEYQ